MHVPFWHVAVFVVFIKVCVVFWRSFWSAFVVSRVDAFGDLIGNLAVEIGRSLCSLFDFRFCYCILTKYCNYHR